MKAFFVFGCTLFVFPCSAKAMTLEELEKGAAATAVFDPKNESLTDSQVHDATLFLSYIKGFADATDSAPALVKIREKEDVEVYQPSEVMRDPATMSASLLNFIRSHRPKGFDSKTARGKDVLTAWYLWNCAGSDYDAKFMAYYGLSLIWGQEFPGADKMRLEISRAVKDKIDAEAKPPAQSEAGKRQIQTDEEAAEHRAK